MSHEVTKIELLITCLESLDQIPVGLKRVPGCVLQSNDPDHQMLHRSQSAGV